MSFGAFLCEWESWNLDPSAVLDSERNNVGRAASELYQVLCKMIRLSDLWAQ